MKTIISVLTLAICITFSNTVNAQKAKLKNDIVYIDGEEKFQFERRNSAMLFTLYTLDKETELVTIYRNNGGTPGENYDDFVQITFPNNDIRIESVSIKGYSFAWFVERLLKDKVLDLEGKIDEDKLRAFALKYDENITNRTLRIR